MISHWWPQANESLGWKHHFRPFVRQCVVETIRSNPLTRVKWLGMCVMKRLIQLNYGFSAPSSERSVNDVPLSGRPMTGVIWREEKTHSISVGKSKAWNGTDKEWGGTEKEKERDREGESPMMSPVWKVAVNVISGDVTPSALFWLFVIIRSHHHHYGKHQSVFGGAFAYMLSFWPRDLLQLEGSQQNKLCFRHCACPKSEPHSVEITFVRHLSINHRPNLKASECSSGILPLPIGSYFPIS